MAMNYSSCSVFSTAVRSGDDDCSSSMRLGGDRGRVGTQYWMGWEFDDQYVYGGGEADREADGCGSRDIADLLPSDPFGMELSSSFSAMLSGWINDIGGGRGGYEVWDSDYEVWGGDYEVCGGELIADFGYCLDHALASSSSEARYGSECVYDVFPTYQDWHVYGFGYVEEHRRSSVGDEAACFGDEAIDHSCDVRSVHSGDVETGHSGDVEVVHSGVDAKVNSGDAANSINTLLECCMDHLGVRDMLILEMVCRSMRSYMQDHPSLWQSIHIDSTLKDRITDDHLLRLTQKARGKLECLSLYECSNITDEGLKHALECSPSLKKLDVARCVRLTIEGLIRNLKMFNSSGKSRITHLKLGSFLSVSPEHFKELISLVDGRILVSPHKQWFYHTSLSTPAAFDDERAIDIELCPICQKFKLVFDCPLESCQGKELVCRACEICIPRCSQCGRCINNCRYVETFCLRYVCADCWKNVPQSPERRGE